MDPQSFHLGCLHILGFWNSPLDSLPLPGRKGLAAPTWQEKKQRVACEVWAARPEDIYSSLLFLLLARSKSQAPT